MSPTLVAATKISKVESKEHEPTEALSIQLRGEKLANIARIPRDEASNAQPAADTQPTSLSNPASASESDAVSARRAFLQHAYS
eukprot:COSAG02_NODE_1737_length_11150_cov_15.164420_3_plen_84_part_00